MVLKLKNQEDVGFSLLGFSAAAIINGIKYIMYHKYNNKFLLIRSIDGYVLIHWLNSKKHFREINA